MELEPAESDSDSDDGFYEECLAASRRLLVRKASAAPRAKHRPPPTPPPPTPPPPTPPPNAEGGSKRDDADEVWHAVSGVKNLQVSSGR